MCRHRCQRGVLRRRARDHSAARASWSSVPSSGTACRRCPTSGSGRTRPVTASRSRTSRSPRPIARPCERSWRPPSRPAPRCCTSPRLARVPPQLLRRLRPRPRRQQRRSGVPLAGVTIAGCTTAHTHYDAIGNSGVVVDAVARRRPARDTPAATSTSPRRRALAGSPERSPG